MLADTELSIGEIVEKYGFSDSSNFGLFPLGVQKKIQIVSRKPYLINLILTLTVIHCIIFIY